AKAKAALAERETELAHERSSARQSRDEAGKLREADADRQRLRDDLAKAKAALAEREADLERERSNVRETRFEAGKLRDADAERQHLRNELANLKVLLAGREKELKQAQEDAKAKGVAASIASTRAVAELESTKNQLAARDEELNQLRSGAETLRGDSVELKRVRAELAATKTSLAARDAELAHAHKEREEALGRAQRELDRALRDADKRWRNAEGERLAAAEEKWRARSDEVIARLNAQLLEAESRVREEAAHHQSRQDVLSESRDAQAALKTLLATRDAELARLKQEHEQAREHWTKEMDSALSDAHQAWKAAEAARTSALEGQWQEQAASSMREMTLRAQKAESALAETRAQMEALRHRGDAADFLRLRKELNQVQGQLARRDGELAQLRSDHELERERLAAQARAAVERADQQWRQVDEEPEEQGVRAQATWHLIRNLLAAAVLGGLAMVGYYKVAPMLTDSGVLDPILPQNSGRFIAPASAPGTPSTVLTVLRSAKLRAGPSTTASVLGSLPANTQVTELGRREKWVRVEVAARAGNTAQQGWVYGTVLSGPLRVAPAAPTVGNK
ncbi:MAG TPA: SH3 domain-containing protein, partial [Rhizomicrobium sp.]|nr:SH3 domain-containing protein [Rhizomicrobium sp.]